VCSCEMMIASSDSGFSPAISIRQKSSLQLNPASTRTRVFPPVIMVEFPFDPDANTVNRTIL
jgi:hypothetical protein